MSALPTAPAGFLVRRPTAADIPAVVALVNAAEIVDLGQVLLEESDLAADWAGASVDLGADVVLVEPTIRGRGGPSDHEPRIVGWAQLDGRSAQADVHPDLRGRGIGTMLAGFLEQRALDVSGTAPFRVGQSVATQPGGGRRLLQSRGWEPAYESWVLIHPPDRPLPTAAAPNGVVIRAHRDEVEERGAHRVIETAFSAWPHRDGRTFEQWRAAATRHPAFRPGLLHVAVDERGGVVGACLGLRYTGDGWIDQIAVDPAWRNRGLGRALIASMFGALQALGASSLGLNTDSRTGALSLYRHLGMVIDLTLVHMELRTPPGGAAAVS